MPYDADELAEARADREAEFDKLADVERDMQSDDGQGGKQATPYVAQQGIRCRVVSRRMPRQIVTGGSGGGQIVSLTDFDVFLPAASGIEAGDRLIIEAGTADSVRLNVVGTDKGVSDALQLTAYCQRQS